MSAEARAALYPDLTPGKPERLDRIRLGYFLPWDCESPGRCGFCGAGIVNEPPVAVGESCAYECWWCGGRMKLTEDGR